MRTCSVVVLTIIEVCRKWNTLCITAPSDDPSGLYYTVVVNVTDTDMNKYNL